MKNHYNQKNAIKRIITHNQTLFPLKRFIWLKIMELLKFMGG